MDSKVVQFPKLRAAVVNQPEIFEIRQTINNTYEPIGGVDYELLELFSHAVPFVYEVVSPEDQQWGSISKNSTSWTGMIGMLQRNEADLALCAMTVTEQRMGVVDFAFPYCTDRLSFTMKAAGKASEDFVYVYPFTGSVWILTCFCLLLGSAMLTLLQRVRPTKDRKWRKTHPFDNFIASLEILIGSRTYQEILHNTASRLFAFVFLLLMRVLAFSYAGILLSFLMTPLMEYQIKTVHELASFSEQGKVEVTSFSSVKYWIPSSPDDPLYGLSRSVRENPESGWVDPAEGGVDWIENNYAVINTLQYQLPEIIIKGMKDKVFVSSDSLLIVYSSIALRKGFCCPKRFDEITLRILQAGLFDKIYENHMFRLYLKAPRDVDEPIVRPIKLKDVKGMLLITIGYVFATIVLIAEICFGKASKRKKVALIRNRKKLKKFQRKKLEFSFYED